MSNKHVNHQHGLTTMNASRPKSKLRKRANKASAKARKAPLLAALQEARYGKKADKAKVAARPKRSVTAAKKAKSKATQKAAKKTTKKTTTKTKKA